MRGIPEARIGSSTLDEPGLVAAVARGDEKAMESFYRAHSDAVFRFIFRRVRECHEDAEELTQDTFVSAIDLSPTFKGDSSAFVWLCGIARLRIVDFYRRRGREKRVPADRIVSLEHLGDGGSGVVALSSPIDSPHVMASIVDGLAAVLTEEEREAFTLRHVEELSLPEMAKLLGRSVRATEGLVYRARVKLREAVLRDYGPRGIR